MIAKAGLSDAKVYLSNNVEDIPLEIMMSGQIGLWPIKGTLVNQDRLVEYGLPRIPRNKWARVEHGEENQELPMFKEDGDSDYYGEALKTGEVKGICITYIIIVQILTMLLIFKLWSWG